MEEKNIGEIWHFRRYDILPVILILIIPFRELYTPGWHAAINDNAKSASSYEKILESVKLPAGKSVVHFYFLPPYIKYALWAFILGLVGLCWEFTVFLKNRINMKKPTVNENKL